jgi:hypothetical protein
LTKAVVNLGQLADLFQSEAKLVGSYSDYRGYAGCSGRSESPRT